MHSASRLTIALTLLTLAFPGLAWTKPCNDYPVQSGDTLPSVAQTYLGSAKKWRQILDANPQLLALALVRTGTKTWDTAYPPIYPGECLAGVPIQEANANDLAQFQAHNTVFSAPAPKNIGWSWKKSVLLLAVFVLLCVALLQIRHKRHWPPD